MRRRAKNFLDSYYIYKRIRQNFPNTNPLNSNFFESLKYQIEQKGNLELLRRSLCFAIENELIYDVKQIIESKFVLNPKYIRDYYFGHSNDWEGDGDSQSKRRKEQSPINSSDMDTNDEMMEICTDDGHNLSMPSCFDAVLSSNQTTKIDFRNKNQETTEPMNWSQFFLDLKRKENALHYAVRLGRTCFIDILLDSCHFNVNDTTGSENLDTALTIACDFGSLDIVKILLERGADPNYQNGKMKTPLILATESIKPYDIQMCEMLVKYGATTNQPTSNRNNVLLSACKFGDLDLVKYLVCEAKADINLASHDGTTPLLRCCYYNYLNVARFLIEHGAFIDARNIRNETSLYIASFMGYFEIVEMLVSKFGAKIDIPDKDGDTPLSVACYENRPEVISYLLKHGANVNVKGIRNDTPLHIAASNCDKKVIGELIKYGGHVDALNNANETPLHICARHGRVEAIEKLLNHAKRLDICSMFDSRTPFKIVIERIQVERLVLGINLIKAGCNVNIAFKSYTNQVIRQTPFKSVFEYLLRIPKHKFKFQQHVQMSSISDSNLLHSNASTTNDLIILSEKKSPIRLYLRLIELIILAGYKLDVNDWKMFKDSWLYTYLKLNNLNYLAYFEKLFLANGVSQPSSLASLCRNRIRGMLNKPIINSISSLDLPESLKEFLYLE